MALMTVQPTAFDIAVANGIAANTDLTLKKRPRC
jgi:hypothetical protein